MREAVHQIKAPHDFVIDIVEYDLNPKFLAVRFYESQWLHYNDSERLKCIMYLDTIKTLLESYGVMVTLEPVIDKGDVIPNKKKVRGIKR
jgi:hypothetical protein